MSDNLTRYRAIKVALHQIYPKPQSGRLAQSLEVLAMFINGIVASGSTHLRAVAKKTPTSAKVTSREKQLSRWYQNEHVSYEVYMLPFVQQLLAGLATQTLVLAIDGSEVGRNCIALMVSLIYQQRAIPLLWLVKQGQKGRFPATIELGLLIHHGDAQPASRAWGAATHPAIPIARSMHHHTLAQPPQSDHQDVRGADAVGCVGGRPRRGTGPKAAPKQSRPAVIDVPQFEAQRRVLLAHDLACLSQLHQHRVLQMNGALQHVTAPATEGTAQQLLGFLRNLDVTAIINDRDQPRSAQDAGPPQHLRIGCVADQHCAVRAGRIH